MAKRKCYPVSGGDVTICNNNKEGRCQLWNKKCNNIIEDKEMAKKEKSRLASWNDVIKESAKQYDEQRKKWQMEMGEPDQIFTMPEYKFGFWKCKDGILVVQIDKRGPNPATQLFYSIEFIEMLVKTLEK